MGHKIVQPFEASNRSKAVLELEVLLRATQGIIYMQLLAACCLLGPLVLNLDSLASKYVALMWSRLQMHTYLSTIVLYLARKADQIFILYFGIFTSTVTLRSHESEHI